MDKEEFIRKLTDSQNGLYAYIYTMIGDHSKANDVLQEANIVMWRKLDNFDGQNFEAWSMTICKFQVMAFLRNKKRDRLLLDPELTEMVSSVAEKEYSLFNRAEPQLLECISSLPDHNREIIEMKYFKKMRLNEIADKLKKKLSAIKVGIHRIRRSLLKCIEQKLDFEES